MNSWVDEQLGWGWCHILRLAKQERQWVGRRGNWDRSWTWAGVFMSHTDRDVQLEGAYMMLDLWEEARIDEGLRGSSISALAEATRINWVAKRTQSLREASNTESAGTPIWHEDWKGVGGALVGQRKWEKASFLSHAVLPQSKSQCQRCNLAAAGSSNSKGEESSSLARGIVVWRVWEGSPLPFF